MSSIDSGHREVGQGRDEGSEEAALVGGGEALDLRADFCFGVSVVQVARRYSMNASLNFTWLRDLRFAPDRDITAPTEDAADSLPVEVEGTAWSSERPDTPRSPRPPETGTVISAQRVDITLSDRHRILVEGPTALSSVVALVQGLTA